MILKIIFTIIFGLLFAVNFVGGIFFYLEVFDEIEYEYDYPNPISVKILFKYWWEFISDIGINIYGEIILMILTILFFLPIIIGHIIISSILFIVWCICKLFLFIFKEDEDKKILREAKRELKRYEKNK